MVRFSLLSRAMFCIVAACGAHVSCVAQDAIPTSENAQAVDALPDDSRLQPLKDLNGYFPFHVPESKQAWEQRSAELRRQVLVATGLYPLPERTPLNAVIHGKVQRDGFTVEKVFFESMPNHFVTGLLFRPDRKGASGKRYPAVLSPHGHGGRMQDYGEDNMAALIDSGAEKFERSGRFPKIARCAHLARMGCVVFIFDMLGYEDSRQISYELAHRFKTQRPDLEGKESWGLYSAQAEMRLQSIMGIQTWNSICCLDFLEQLPDVDSERIAVTGGSGGGTQTILLCAIDDRPVAGFPNGMVSTAMQGGCTCENCSLLRIGTGNVELAALFAPKPQAMTAANDWTKDMMTKGYPELKQIYGLLGAEDNVYCRPLLHFPHNYNYVSRETMYAWFNQHLSLGLTDFVETDFEPLTKDEASVWNDEYPMPAGGEAYERELTRYLADSSDSQIAELTPNDAESFSGFRDLVGGAFQAIVGRSVPDAAEVVRKKLLKMERDDYYIFEDRLQFQDRGEEVPTTFLYPKTAEWSGDVVIWLDGAGRQALNASGDKLPPQVRQIVESGAAVLGADLFQQGAFLGKNSNQDVKAERQRTVKNSREAACYSFCYNDTLFAQRVHDVLTLVAYVSGDERVERISLIGTQGVGPVAALARVIAGDKVSRAAIDTEGFRFEDVTDYLHPSFLPGAVKYGDLPAILALNAPNALQLIGEPESPALTRKAYAAAQADTALQLSGKLDVTWLLAN